VAKSAQSQAELAQKLTDMVQRFKIWYIIYNHLNLV
jgi:hypothetical protein